MENGVEAPQKERGTMKVMSCLFYTLFLAVFSSSVVVASSVIKEQEGLFVSQKTLPHPIT